MSDDFNMIKKILEGSEYDGLYLGELSFLKDIGLSEEGIITNPNTKIGNYGGVKVYVYPEKSFSNKPHMHLVCPKFKKGDCIVRLDNNSQWPHADHQTIIGSDECLDLDILMRQPYKKDRSLTNWNAAVEFWNKNHPNNKINISEQPNYTKSYLNIDESNKK